MIVRIMGEGQLVLADTHLARLNELDDELLADLEKDDEAAFRLTLNALLEAVRELGEPLPDDSLEPSELILPSADATVEEVRTMLSNGEASGTEPGGGLIPG